MFRLLLLSLLLRLLRLAALLLLALLFALLLVDRSLRVIVPRVAVRLRGRRLRLTTLVGRGAIIVLRSSRLSSRLLSPTLLLPFLEDMSMEDRTLEGRVLGNGLSHISPTSTFSMPHASTVFCMDKHGGDWVWTRGFEEP